MNTLPLITLAVDDLPSQELKDYYIIGVQHLLPTTLYMFRHLFNKGLKPENVSLLGKCYSTNLDAYDAMLNLKMDICSNSIHFDFRQSYDIQFIDYVREFIYSHLDRIQSSEFKKVIVIDDGGHMLDELLKICDNPNILRKIVGIEQTSSGYNILKNKKLNIPIINLARAKTKLQLEPLKIIKNAILKIFDYSNHIDFSIKRILICGNGAVGNQVKQLLSSDYKVFTYDIDSEKSDFTQKQLQANLDSFDLIIGATGNTSLTKDFHPYLRNSVILASISSSDREFDAYHLRRKVNGTSTCFQHLLIDGIHLLNCGFPVNFNNSNVDEPYFFQLIRALIIKAIIQASKLSYQNGFIDLNYENQKQILSHFNYITRNFNKINYLRSKISSLQEHKKLLTEFFFSKNYDRVSLPILA